MDTVHPSQPIQLRWDSGKVVFTPENQDRFVLSAQATMNACQAQLAFTKALEAFFNECGSRIRDWCESRSEQIEACFVPLPLLMEVTKVFIIGRERQLDFDLIDQASSLEVALGQIGWNVDIVQLPAASAETLRSYFDAGNSVKLYGNA